MKSLIALLMLFSIVFSSCKKNQSEDVSPVGDVVISKDAKVINSQTWDKNFQSLDSVNNIITFSKEITSTQPMYVGDILVSSAGEGLLRKVKSVTTVGNSIKVQTETATLTDAIDKGMIDFKQPLTVSQIKSIKYYYGGIGPHNGNIGDLKQATQSWDINTILYDNDKNPSTTYDQIKLVGTFNCDWLLAGRIEIGLLDGLKEVKFGFESSENLDLQFIAGMQYGFEKSFKLATVYFTPFVVQVGVVPVVFTPQLDIYAGFDGYANGSITTGINQRVSFNTGMQYLKNQGWSPFTILDKTLNFQPPSLNLNAGASAYIKPEITVKIYSVVGPYANLKLYERLDANILQTPWWKFYAGVKMDAGVKVSILDKFLLECTMSDILKYEVMLSQATTPPVFKPTATTSDVTNITTNSATVGGNISTDGGAPITERGVYWGTTPNPETTGTKIQIGSGLGVFSSNLTGLQSNTKYYVRTYSINSAGTSLGNEISFITQINYGTISDIDGNTYKTVTIGTQIWMAENLKTTKYNDGSAIPLVTDNNAWHVLSTSAYCWYNNNVANKNPYGALYNWYAVNTEKICPNGWHVATQAEWTIMQNFLKDPTGNSEMESGNSHWLCIDSQVNNNSGFSAVPGGGRYNGGIFNEIGYTCYFWKSTEDGRVANYQYLFRDKCGGGYNNNQSQKSGFSVRCLHD